MIHTNDNVKENDHSEHFNIICGTLYTEHYILNVIYGTIYMEHYIRNVINRTL